METIEETVDYVVQYRVKSGQNGPWGKWATGVPMPNKDSAIRLTDRQRAQRCKDGREEWRVIEVTQRVVY